MTIAQNGMLARRIYKAGSQLLLFPEALAPYATPVNR